MLDNDNLDIQYNQYTGQEYVYCMSCKAYIPLNNID